MKSRPSPTRVHEAQGGAAEHSPPLPRPPLQAPGLILSTLINQDLKDFRSEDLQGRGLHPSGSPFPGEKNARTGRYSFQEVFVNHLICAWPCERSRDRPPSCPAPHHPLTLSHLSTGTTALFEAKISRFKKPSGVLERATTSKSD